MCEVTFPAWQYYPRYYIPQYPQQDTTIPVQFPMYVWNQYETMNDLIAVEPFKTDAVEKHGVKSGFATVKQKVELTPLTVVFGTRDIPQSAIVYVRGDLCVEPDSKKIYEIDNKKFILISVKEIKIVQKIPVTTINASVSTSGTINTK